MVRKKKNLASLLSGRVFDARLDSFLVPSCRIPRVLFSRQLTGNTSQVNQEQVEVLTGAVSTRSRESCYRRVVEVHVAHGKGTEREGQSGLYRYPPASPPSLPFIRRNPTNRRLRVCGSAASPRLGSRSHNSFDRRTERFRFVENGNTNVSKLTCAPFHRFAVIIREDLLFVVFESGRCTCLPEFTRHLISSVHGGRCSPAETRTMRFSWMFVATVLLVLVTEARCKRKFDGDFEFAEEVSPLYFIYNYITFLACLLSYDHYRLADMSRRVLEPMKLR